MYQVIDAHVHIGNSTEDYFKYIRNSNIKGAVMFPPVDEIYNRYIKNFKDDAKWLVPFPLNKFHFF